MTSKYSAKTATNKWYKVLTVFTIKNFLWNFCMETCYHDKCNWLYLLTCKACMFYKYIFVTGRITSHCHSSWNTQSTTLTFNVQPPIHIASTLHKVIFQFGREAWHFWINIQNTNLLSHDVFFTKITRNHPCWTNYLVILSREKKVDTSFTE